MMEVSLQKPKVVGPDYVQSFDNMSATDFMKIYLETLRYQDPFRQQDLSKSLEDVVRLNQIKFFTEMKSFIEGMTSWMNQMTFLRTIDMIGKEFVFSSNILDTVKGGEYVILSGEKVSGVKVRVYDGEELVKEISMDLDAGLNPLPLDDLPDGQFSVKVMKDGFEVQGWELGVREVIVSVGIVNGELMLETASGRRFPASRIIYAGGENRG
ncbi:MAG TPA: flagellar hook assembly protein FlgD [Aquifex aeolicus]|nr:flagellar hook assembly protein FlgD [Aquifex aeolicus]